MNFKKTALVVAAAGALTALAVPAMAEVTLYGSFRLLTFVDFKENAAAGKTTNYDQPLANTSRFGAKVSDGALGGQVEFGLNGGNLNAAYTPADTAFVYTRLMYGTYKFASGTLLAGQDYNKYWLPSARVFAGDDPNNGFGALYDGRQPQLRFTMSNGLYVGLIKPVYSTTADAVLPKFNIGFDGAAGTAKYGAGAMFQTYKETVCNNKSINSYLVYAKAIVGLGAAELKANIGYGQNLGNSGFTNTTATGVYKYTAATKTAGEKIDDATTLSGYIQGSYTFSPTIKTNVIYGYTANDRTDYKHTDDMSSLTLNVPVTVAKNFTITPEVTYIDQLKNSKGDKEKKNDTYVGAKWQLDF